MSVPHVALPVITILFTEDDVKAVAEAHSVPLDTALERAAEWGRHIEHTATALCSEQLTSCIVSGQP